MAKKTLFKNFYKCPYDGTKWEDEWSCACNDRCPECNTEIEPYDWEEVTDYSGPWDEAVRAGGER